MYRWRFFFQAGPEGGVYVYRQARTRTGNKNHSI